MRFSRTILALGALGLGTCAHVASRHSTVVDLPTVTGGLSAQQVTQVVWKNLGAIDKCYDAALVGHPDLAGKVVLTWRIDGHGAAADPQVFHSTAQSPALESCMLASVRLLHFPRPRGGSARVELFGFTFKIR